jgi:hypothetical protein
VLDAFLKGDGKGADSIGKRIVLPSSFSGGPRQMMQLFQDAIAVVRYYGKPDLFITVTFNPNCPELLAELRPGETPNDRPDLIVRLFRLKLIRIIKGEIINLLFF